jgi:glycosyltransferase involved in cell wall biosynthesis
VRLAVFSHKPCRRRADARGGFETDGGFPAQMRALAGCFDETVLLVPCAPASRAAGGSALEGRGLRVAPLTPLSATGWRRKAAFPFWLLRNAPAVARALARTDAVHAAVPGDVGTAGLALALLLRRPLLVRYCNNWFATRTATERVLKWAMRRFAGGRNVMLATGGAEGPPAPDSPGVEWIFATSLEDREIRACGRLRDRLPGAAPRLVLAGRQEKGKGTDALLESLPEIARTFPGVTLEVLGDGAALDAFRRLAGNLGVASRVTFRGNVRREDVVASLRAADLFCFPTASEGFPKVVLEALACGLPVLTTRVSVLPVLLARGAGLLLDDAAPASIAAGVRRALSDGPAYTEMSARALETAREYSLERWQDEIARRARAAWGPLRATPASGPGETAPARPPRAERAVP